MRPLTVTQEETEISEVLPGSFYNYLPTTDIESEADFLPMIFDAAHCTPENVAAAADYDPFAILGFNEPDNSAPQADMTPAEAAGLWPLIQASDKPLGSPVIAGSLTTANNWYDQFLALFPDPTTVDDYVCVHRYQTQFSAPTTAANQMMSYLLSVYNKYRKPLIISEFGMIDFVGGDPSNWLYPTEAQAIAWIGDIVLRLRRVGWIKKFFWYPNCLSASDIATNPNSANVRLIDENGVLTAVGRAYRNAMEIRL